MLMEGADGIRSVDELPEWHDRGVRLIGLAWAGTRYSGGTREPGPLTEEGRALLAAMADLGFVLDLSHMDEAAALGGTGPVRGPTGGQPCELPGAAAEFPDEPTLSDPVLRRIIERDGIIGNMPVNSFLKTGWSRKKGSKREEVPLDTFAAHLDHVCQLAGDSLHAGIGSDFDGGFGLQSVPPEIDTVADLQKIVPLLERRGDIPTGRGEHTGPELAAALLRRACRQSGMTRSTGAGPPDQCTPAPTQPLGLDLPRHDCG